MTTADWDAPAFPGGTRTVRNGNEANLFVDVQRGRILDTRITGDDFEILAETPEGNRIFAFRLAAAKPHDATDLGEGTSSVLTPADLVLYAGRVERELPDPPEMRGRNARRLALAAAALRQAARFAGDGDAIPETLLTGAVAKRMFSQEPGRFSKQALLAQADRLDALADQWAGR